MLISFEGIDGSGKTTQAYLLAQALDDLGYRVARFREPGSTPVGEAIRNILEDTYSITPAARALLYNAARAQLVEEKIKPALAENKIVILDRFHDSTIAYQGCGDGVALSRLRLLEPLTIQALYPDLTFFLSIPYSVALERDPMLDEEYRPFYERVIYGYTQIMNGDPRWRSIDGELPVMEVHVQILEFVKEKLNGCRKENS